MGFAAGGKRQPGKDLSFHVRANPWLCAQVRGKGIANPVASVESVRMMLEHLGEEAAGKDIEKGLARVLSGGKFKTRDMGGKHSTSEMETPSKRRSSRQITATETPGRRTLTVQLKDEVGLILNFTEQSNYLKGSKRRGLDRRRDP